VKIRAFALAVLAHAVAASAAQVRLAELDVTLARQDWGKPAKDKSVDGRALTIAGKTFATGLGTHASGELIIRLDGKADSFAASVGLDDETLPDRGSVEFLVALDGKVVWQSGVMRTGDAAKPVSVSLKGAKLLTLLVVDAGDGDKYDHAAWADATIVYDGEPPAAIASPLEERVVLTPRAAPAPRINGARAFGARPGAPILVKVAASGV
jgi:alpha-galactosidase